MIRDPEITVEDANAIHALTMGKASEGQQQHAVALILGKLCGIWRDDAQDIEHDREVHHAAGRLWVGRWINRLADPALPAALKKAEALKRDASTPKTISRTRGPKK